MTPRKLVVLSVTIACADAGTTALVFLARGSKVEANPLVPLLARWTGAYGALLVILAVRVAMAFGAGALRRRMVGRRAQVFSLGVLVPAALVVLNNMAALVLIVRS